MGFQVEISHLNYGVRGREILRNIDLRIEPGSFAAILGENGAGKTTLLDLIMGFREPSNGMLKVDEEEPYLDHWMKRQDIAYLFEKVDIPGDWSAKEFLAFNKFFYSKYLNDREEHLISEFRVDKHNRLGNMSAGEIRRVQTVAALSIQPKLIVVDEITAVLDIVGRRKFMRMLDQQSKETNCTIVLATNILEDLATHISHVLLIRKGNIRSYQSLDAFLGGSAQSQFSQKVADILEEE